MNVKKTWNNDADIDETNITTNEINDDDSDSSPGAKSRSRNGHYSNGHTNHRDESKSNSQNGNHGKKYGSIGNNSNGTNGYKNYFYRSRRKNHHLHYRNGGGPTKSKYRKGHLGFKQVATVYEEEEHLDEVKNETTEIPKKIENPSKNIPQKQKVSKKQNQKNDGVKNSQAKKNKRRKRRNKGRNNRAKKGQIDEREGKFDGKKSRRRRRHKHKSSTINHTTDRNFNWTKVNKKVEHWKPWVCSICFCANPSKATHCANCKKLFQVGVDSNDTLSDMLKNDQPGFYRHEDIERELMMKNTTTTTTTREIRRPSSFFLGIEKDEKDKSLQKDKKK